MKAIKELKSGEYFTRKPVEDPKDSQVWVRGAYVPGAKAYECFNFADVCRTILIKGKTEVFTDFTF